MILMAGGFLAHTHFQIQRGDILPYEGSWYTKEELAKKFPYYEDVPAKNTPEQVYATYRQALLDSDIELALEQIMEKKREEYRKIFIADPEILKKISESLPMNITKDHEYEYSASYDVDMGTKYKNTVDFVKNLQGFWKIKYI